MLDQRPTPTVSRRLDRGHVRTDPGAPPELASIAGVNPQAADNQVQRQAAEIASLLRVQQQNVDCRVAELNARIAQLEDNLRTSRLKARHASIGPGDSPAQVTVDDQQCQQIRRETLAKWQHALHDSGICLAGPDQKGGSPTLITTTQQDHSERCRDTSQGEPAPTQRFPRGDAIPAEPEAERELLLQRKYELNRRRAVVERMQEEVELLHREAVEMRLIAEQIWAELTRTTPPDVLARSTAQLRDRLSEQFRRQHRTLSDRKAELVGFQDGLRRKQRQLCQQAERLQHWVDLRHQQIRQRAADLAARERQLEWREAHLSLAATRGSRDE